MKGFTLLELLITITIIFILTSVVQPVSKITSKRLKEIELRRNLRIVRQAIDEFKSDWDKKIINQLDADSANPETGYPEELETLLEETPLSGPDNKFKKYLRRIPENPFKDPSDSGHGWGLRCYRDEPDSSSWCGDDIYDIYAETSMQALDESYYQDW